MQADYITCIKQNQTLYIIFHSNFNILNDNKYKQFLKNVIYNKIYSTLCNLCKQSLLDFNENLYKYSTFL